MKNLLLDFGSFTCKAELFDVPISRKLIDYLPCTVELTKWGNELYGPIGAGLGSESPVTVIPDGGIAYSERGHYICIFYGQTPAWPVDHIGSIVPEDREKLHSYPAPTEVKISLK